jgi:hypothetical protein
LLEGILGFVELKELACEFWDLNGDGDWNSGVTEFRVYGF